MPFRSVTVVLVLLVGAVPAFAQDDAKERAAAHFARAEQAERAGDWQTAYDEYEAAYAAVPHPDVLYNMGSVAARLGKLREAAELFRRYLSESEARPADARQVEQTIRDLERRADAEDAADAENAARETPQEPPPETRHDRVSPPPGITRDTAVVVEPERPGGATAWRVGLSYGIGIGDVPVERYQLVGSFALVRHRIQAELAAGLMGRNDIGAGVGARYWLTFDRWRPFVRVLGTIGYATTDASSSADTVFPKSVELGLGIAWASASGEVYAVLATRRTSGGVTEDDTLSDSHINDATAVTFDVGWVFGSRDSTAAPVISIRR